MAKIWVCLMLVAAMLALVNGRADAASTALMDSGGQALALLATLLSTMPLWSGLMEILAASGDVARLGRMFRKILKPLFPGLEDDEAWNAISMNLSANLLGLGNAATPAGIDAAKRLSRLGQNGMRALAMLLVLDNAGAQLMPTTVITLRHAAGAENPADIWGMTLVIGGVTMAASAVMMRLLQGGGNRHGRRSGKRHHGGGGVHSAQGCDDGL